MIRVRRHERQLPSGKTATVRQHERTGQPKGRDTADDWWDRPADPQDAATDQPEGTWYFRQDDELMAVHPDGTVHAVAAEGSDGDSGSDEPPGGGGWSPEDEPEGTWYLKEGDDTYAVHPDGTTRLVPPDEPAGESEGAPHRTYCGCVGKHLAGCPNGPNGATPPRATDVPLGPAGHGHATDVSTGPAAPESRAFTRMKGDMRFWRSRSAPSPRPDKPMQPALARALGCDTPEGREKYDRGRAYREAGYTGPLDSDNRIPDPDDPANHESLSALAALGEL